MRIKYVVLAGGIFIFLLGASVNAYSSNGNTGSQEVVENPEVLKARIQSLRVAAEKFAKAFAHRDFKTMYEMINIEYRRRVPLWEYKDFVDYPGVTDGYIEVKVADVNVLPKGNNKYGKVMQKIIISENQQNKTTGQITKVESEKWEFQDWAYVNGVWYKIEKIDSN